MQGPVHMGGPVNIGGPGNMQGSGNMGGQRNIGGSNIIAGPGNVPGNIRAMDNIEGPGNMIESRNLGPQFNAERQNRENYENNAGDYGNMGGPQTNNLGGSGNVRNLSDPGNMKGPSTSNMIGQENMGHPGNMGGPRIGDMRPPGNMANHRNSEGYDGADVQRGRMGGLDSQQRQMGPMGGEGNPYGRAQSVRQADGVVGPGNVMGHSGHQKDDGSSFMGERSTGMRGQNPAGQSGGPAPMGVPNPLRDERSGSRGRFNPMGPDSLENERHGSMQGPNSFGRPNSNQTPDSLGRPNFMGGQSSSGVPNPASMGGPGAIGGPGYPGDRNDLDMEYDNYGGQERYDQVGAKRGLSREAAKSMAALDQRQVEGSQRGDSAARAGGLAHSQSSSDLRPTGQMGGMSRQGGRVNIFREALKGAAGNKDARMEGRVGREEPSRPEMPNYEGRGNPTPMHREEGGQWEREGDRRRDHLPYSPSQEEGSYGRKDEGREEQRRMGRGNTEEEYEPYDNYGRRGDSGSSGSRREDWGGREGFNSGRSSQPRADSSRSQPPDQGRGWPGASGSR